MIKQETKKKHLSYYTHHHSRQKGSASLFKNLLKRLEIYGSKSIKTQQSPLLYRILNPKPINHTFNFQYKIQRNTGERAYVIGPARSLNIRSIRRWDTTWIYENANGEGNETERGEEAEDQCV